MIDIKEISDLVQNPSGMWCSRETENTSFPDDGNSARRPVEGSSFWYYHRNQCILNALNCFPPQGAILDVGGGNGTVSSALQKEGFEAVLLEPELLAAEDALKKGMPSVICSTFDKAKFKQNSLPAIGMFDVLEHMEDEAGFLSRLKNSLQQGGKLYLTVPAFDSLWSEADEQAGHFRRYTVKSLSDIVNKTGFRLLYSTYFFSVLVLPVYLLRALPYKLGKRHADNQWRHQHHKSQEETQGRNIVRLLQWETHWLRTAKKVPFGSSILLVAEKI